MAQSKKKQSLNDSKIELGLGDSFLPPVKADIEKRVEESQQAENNHQEPYLPEPGQEQGGVKTMSPCQVFEANVNNYLAQFGHQIPFTELVGFLELKLIELKESYRFTTEQNMRQMAEAKENGHTH